MKDLESLSPLVREWIERGKRDLGLAALGLDHEENSDAVAVSLQQAMEKITKGALLATGWRLRKTHDIEQLLYELIERLPESRDFLDLGRILTTYFEDDRYPPGSKIELNSEDMHFYYNGVERFTNIVVLWLKAQRP